MRFWATNDTNTYTTYSTVQELILFTILINDY